MKKITKALVIAASIATSVPLVTAVPANAAVGNTVCYLSKGSSPYSPDSIKIWLQSDNVARLYKGHCSSEPPAVQNNPRGFYIEYGGGCTSQWGYHYATGNWYMFKSNNNTLKLTCS